MGETSEDVGLAGQHEARANRGRRLARAASRTRGDLPLIVLDVVMVTAAYSLALLARFEFHVPADYWQTFRTFVIVACGVHVVSTWAWGCYGRAWRHASFDEARRLLLAGATSLGILLAVFGWNDRQVPLSVLVAGAPLATLLCGLVRFQSRLFAFRRSGGGPEHRVVVVGAGVEAATALREMQAGHTRGMKPVAIIDDDRSLRHRSIHGVPVAGGLDQLADVVNASGADQILLTLGNPPRATLREVVEAADVTGVPVRVLRPSASWIHGMPRLRDIRELDIEDLLRREPVSVDLEPVRRLLSGRRVLVTGGGGWIGSEIARQVAMFEPAELVILDHDETHLHDAVQGVGGRCLIELVDIRDAKVLEAAFTRRRPEVVFHAAAHKHVPILEDFACEAIRTNVFGTANVIDSCLRTGTRALVGISTDKAATPTSVMGASKWLAEQLLLDRGRADGYCAVRFGNVLGSRGSVIPTFQRQIEDGGPITVTDRDMTRFFMSTDEAVRLVLVGASSARAGTILVLEMGEQMNIYELAERMIRLCGRQPHEDIAIQVTGLRPGENIAEALIGPAEHVIPGDGGPVIAIEPFRMPSAEIDGVLGRLRVAVDTHDEGAARTVLLGTARRATLDSVPTLE
jgi:FlaA1/EpsC-like NDP-sugar epimerase